MRRRSPPPDDRPHLERPRHRAACPRGQPRRRPARRRGTVRRDDRGDDVGDREGEQRTRARGPLDVRPVRAAARCDRCPRRGPVPTAPPPASPRSPAARRIWSRSRRASPTSPSCRIPMRARTCRPPTRCTPCCSNSGRPVLISPQVAPDDDRHAHMPRLERHCRSRPRRSTRRCPGCSGRKRCAILSAEGYQRRGPAAPDLAAYLALHDVHAEIVDVPVGGQIGRRRAAERRARLRLPTCWRWAPIRTPGCVSSSSAASPGTCWRTRAVAGDDEPLSRRSLPHVRRGRCRRRRGARRLCEAAARRRRCWRGWSRDWPPRA